MKTHSAKAKGRKLQQWVAELMRSLSNAPAHEARSTSMGAPGVDVHTAGSVRKRFPFSIECKNQERVSLWKAWDQATANAEDGLQPILVIKKNRSAPLVVLDAQYFFEQWSKHYDSNA